MSMKFKRFLSLTLALLMIVGMMPTNFGVTADAASNGTAVSLYPDSSVWATDGAWFAAYYWKSNTDNGWVKLTDENNDGYYEGTIPAGYTNVIFTRMNPANTTLGWDNKWNQTNDLSISGKDTFTITGWDNGTGVGNWSCRHLNQSTTTVASTCIAAGSTTVTCDVCNKQVSKTELALADHNFGTDGKCTTDGCTAECEHEWYVLDYENDLNMTNQCKFCEMVCEHDTWSTWDQDESAYVQECDLCGQLCQHQTHTQEGVCSVCGKTGVRHTMPNCSCGYKCQHENMNGPICMECSNVCGNDMDHKLGEDGICTVCGKPPVPTEENVLVPDLEFFCGNHTSSVSYFGKFNAQFYTPGEIGYDGNTETWFCDITRDIKGYAEYLVAQEGNPLYGHTVPEDVQGGVYTFFWHENCWVPSGSEFDEDNQEWSGVLGTVQLTCDNGSTEEPTAPAAPYHRGECESNLANADWIYSHNMVKFVCEECGEVVVHVDFEGNADSVVKNDDGTYTYALPIDVAAEWEKASADLIDTHYLVSELEESYVLNLTWDAQNEVWLIEAPITVAITCEVDEPEEKTYVAEVNGDSYETLADAFDAAQSGDTITLIADVTVDEMITVKNKSVTLDLNGKTVTAGELSATSDYVLWVQNNAALTVNDSAENGTIVNDRVYGYAILNQGTLTVNGGTFIGDTALWNGYDNINAVATINGGVFNANKASEYSLYAVGNAGTLTVNDGEITDWVDTFGTLNIKGGAVENIYIDDSRASVAQRATTVSGGEVGCLYVDENNEENAVSVSGGTFTEAPEAEYIAAGYKLVENENGTYSVELKKVDISVPEDVETPEDVEEEVVEQIVESIVNNTAITHPENINRLNATSYKDGADTLPGEDVDINSVIKIELKSIAAEDTAISAITFDVTPVLTWTEEGEEKEAEIKEFNAPITFRLPVPSVITGEYVIVKHEGDSMGKFEIKGEGNNRYVELKSDKFSLYSMEPVPAATLDNGCVTKGSDKVRITVEAHNVYATESIVLKLYSAAFGDEPIATSTGVETLLNKNYSTLTTSFMIKGTSSSWTTVWAEGHPIAWAEPDRAELYVDGVNVAESKVTTNSADTVESAKIAWSEVEGVNPAPASIGKIGYKNLQAAVDAVKNGETILLNPEVTHTEGATINNGVQFTIDGQMATVTASIVLGLNQNVTVKNINFVNTGVDEIYFIKTNSKNSNPILVVDGCTFTGKEGTTTVGVLTQHPTDVTIKNCTGTKLHSLLQNTNGHKVTVENVEVEAYEGGLNLNNVITAVIKNVEITSAGEYGIRLDAGNASNITAENVTVNAENGIPVYVRKATKDGWNLTLNGENALTAKEGYPVIALNKDKDYGVSNGEVTVTQPEAKITVTLSGTGVEGENILGVVHSVGNKYYTVMPKGTLDGGAVVNNGTTGNDGSYINFEIRDYVAFDSMQIKLFSGETLISTTVLAKSEYLNNGNISCAAEITRNSSSWDTTWETAPNAGQIPTKAELWIDGIKVSETEKIGIYDMPGHVENWADIEGVATIEVINGEESEWFNTLAEALAAAEDGATVKLHESVKVLAATGEVTGGKTVTVTGKATFDWSKGWLFVGRGSNEGNGKLIFNKAQIASASNNSSCGLNISGAKKGSATTNYGTVEMINSTVEVDYMLNANDLTLDNTKLTVKNGFRVSGRPANETPDGEMGSATMTVKNGSSVTVDNENGMGIADEGKGTLNLENSTFTALRTFTVHEDNGTFNVSGESKIVAEKLSGTVTVAADATLTDSTIGGDITMLGNLTINGGLTLNGGLWASNGGTLSGDPLKANYAMFQTGEYVIDADLELDYGYLSFNGTFAVNSTIKTAGTSGEVLYIRGTVDLNDGAALECASGIFLDNAVSILNVNTGATINASSINITKETAQLNIKGGDVTVEKKLTNAGVINMNAGTKITTGSINGTGTITIDAAEIAAAEIGTKATVIVLTDRPQNIDSLNIELVNGLGVELKYSNDDGSVYLERSATVAANGDVAYATVQEAIAAAAQNDGDKTVKLLCDVTEENATVIVSGGVTLDLNGFDLDVSHIAAFTGNHIVDSNTEKGLLKVAKGNIMVQSNNKQMAVYTGNGYIFTAVNVNQIMFDSSYTEGVFKVKFKPGFGNNGGASIAKTYFGDNGSKDNGIEIGLLLTWELADGTQVTQTFDYAAEMIMDAYNNNRVFTLAVTGIGSISELDIQLVVKSDVGAIASSAALEYSRN